MLNFLDHSADRGVVRTLYNLVHLCKAESIECELLGLRSANATFIHYNPEIIDADRQGKSPYDFSPQAITEIRQIKAILDKT